MPHSVHVLVPCQPRLVPRIVLGLRHESTVATRYVSLLRLLRIGRAYRLNKVRLHMTFCACVVSILV
jgi:hypothetical protein